MNEFFNWHDFGYVISHNIWWLLLAFALGIFFGWRTCDMSANARGN
jgi:hypothetical protein